MMEKSFSIAINLLPQLETEVLVRQKRFKKIQLFSTIVVVLLLFLASLTFALAIIQNFRLKESEADLNQAKEQVEQLKGVEASLIILKDRLKEIERLQSQPAKQALLYVLIKKLTPSSLGLNTVIVDRNSNADLGLTAQDAIALDTFLNDLLNSQKNENLIKSVALNNFSRTRDGLYKIALKLSGEEK